MISWGWELEKGLTANGQEGTFWGHGNVLKLCSSDGCTTASID